MTATDMHVKLTYVFSARRQTRANCYRNSLRPSVYLSVTLAIHAQIIQYIDIRCAAHDRAMF